MVKKKLQTEHMGEAYAFFRSGNQKDEIENELIDILKFKDYDVHKELKLYLSKIEEVELPSGYEEVYEYCRKTGRNYVIRAELPESPEETAKELCHALVSAYGGIDISMHEVVYRESGNLYYEHDGEFYLLEKKHPIPSKKSPDEK